MTARAASQSSLLRKFAYLFSAHYVREALQTADKTEVTYDPTLGYPVNLHIDRIELAMDDEMSVLISEFEVLP